MKIYKNISSLSKGGTSSSGSTTWTKLCSKRKLPLQGNFKNLCKIKPSE